jgi:S-adenosylmethionine-diacylglycerol 3-amino-3-carboxypropyl transferase
VQPLTLRDRIDQSVFNAIYARSLVYNTCWEDPAVDRLALDLGPEDTLLVITSAGCNVLDYAIAGPRRIHAVDANPRQTALLELKLAGIRNLGFEDFFLLFGQGVHADFRDLYHDALRRDLSPFARSFWDERPHWFARTPGRILLSGPGGDCGTGLPRLPEGASTPGQRGRRAVRGPHPGRPAHCL